MLYFSVLNRRRCGATENAGVENAIRAKLQGGKCRSKLYGAPARVYVDRILKLVDLS